MNRINDPVDVLQGCRPNPEELNEFSQELFVDRINKMNSEKFNSFCKYILRLREFYDWNLIKSLGYRYGQGYNWQRRILLETKAC